MAQELASPSDTHHEHEHGVMDQQPAAQDGALSTHSSGSSMNQAQQGNDSSAGSTPPLANTPKFAQAPNRIAITPQQSQLFNTLFDRVSEGGSSVTLDQVKSTFKESRLDPGYLWAVWQMCDIGAKQHLTQREFMYAMFFIDASRRASALVPLPQQGIPHEGDIEVQQQEAFETAGVAPHHDTPPAQQIAPAPINTTHQQFQKQNTGFDDDSFAQEPSPATDAHGMVSSAAAHAAQTRVNELLQETRMINQDMFRINQLSEMSKAQYDEMKTQANTLQQALQSYQQDIERVLRERRQVQSELFTMRAQVVLMQKDKEAFASQMSSLQQKVEEARQEKNQLTSEKTVVEKSLSETRNDASTKSRELEDLNVQVTKLRAEIEVQRSQSSSTNLEDVQKQIEGKQKELEELRQENAHLKQNVQESTTQHSEASKKLNTDLPNQIKEEQQKRDALQAQLREAESQLSVQNTSELNENAITKLRAALKEASSSLDHFNRLLNDPTSKKALPSPIPTPATPARQLPPTPKRDSKELPATVKARKQEGFNDDFYVDEDEFGDNTFGATAVETKEPSKRTLPTPPSQSSSASENTPTTTSAPAADQDKPKQLPTPPARTSSSSGFDLPAPTKQLPTPPVAKAGDTKKLPTPPPAKKAQEFPSTSAEPETPSGFGEFENFGKSSGFDDFENAFTDDNAFANAFNDFEEEGMTENHGADQPPSKNDPFADAFAEDDGDDWGDF